jgi:putative ABC transport system permease protein
VTRAVLLEALVIVVPAVALAALAAVWLVPAASNSPTFVAAAAVGIVAIFIVLTTALSGLRGAGLSTRVQDDVPRGVSIRRLVFDGLVIVLAVAATWLLRERGIRGSSSATALAAADPLIAAVPVLVGVAAGLVLVRLAPIPLRALGRVAARGRGLVPVLALRHAAQGGTTTAILVVLLLAASIGAFSTAALVHLDRASAASSWQEIGAPFRITALPGTLPSTLDVAHLPGVRTAATVFQSLVAMGEHRQRPRLLAVDLAAYESITGGSPGDLAPPPEMLAEQPAGGVIPLLVSESLARRPDGIHVGDAFPIAVSGYPFQARVVGVRRTFPSVDASSFFAIVNRQQLKAIHPEALLGPSIVLVDAPESAGPAIQSAVMAATPIGVVESRLAFERDFTGSPVTAAIQAGILVSGVVAALYAAVSVAAALALSGAARAREIARLRTMGLSRRDTLGLATLEHGPTVVIAAIAGIALGLGVFLLVEPGLGLDGLIGSRVDVPFTIDPRQLGAILGVVLAIAAFGVALAAWTQRRGTPIAALRGTTD